MCKKIHKQHIKLKKNNPKKTTQFPNIAQQKKAATFYRNDFTYIYLQKSIIIAQSHENQLLHHLTYQTRPNISCPL